MNVTNNKSSNELIQFKNDSEASTTEVNEYLTTVKNDYADRLNPVCSWGKAKESGVNLPSSHMPASMSAQSPVNSEETGITLNRSSQPTPLGALYKQQCVLSIIRDFWYSRTNYEIDFTSTNINKANCRNLMKFVLAIVISEEEKMITEESVETALKTLDIPIFFDLALNNMLNLFKNFAKKVPFYDHYLYLVDAEHRWASNVYVNEELAFGEIPCDFSRRRILQGGKYVTDVTLLFTMFGNRYELGAIIDESTDKVETMKLKISEI